MFYNRRQDNQRGLLLLNFCAVACQLNLYEAVWDFKKSSVNSILNWLLSSTLDLVAPISSIVFSEINWYAMWQINCQLKLDHPRPVTQHLLDEYPNWWRRDAVDRIRLLWVCPAVGNVLWQTKSNLKNDVMEKKQTRLYTVVYSSTDTSVKRTPRVVPWISQLPYIWLSIRPTSL